MDRNKPLEYLVVPEYRASMRKPNGDLHKTAVVFSIVAIYPGLRAMKTLEHGIATLRAAQRKRLAWYHTK